MKITDFVKEYDLHDSFIESIESNEDEQVVILHINFAFWMQKGYVEDSPENGVIKVVFHGVRECSCDGGDPAGDFVGILKAEYKDGAIVIHLLDDETVLCFDLTIVADEVSVG